MAVGFSIPITAAKGRLGQSPDREPEYTNQQPNGEQQFIQMMQMEVEAGGPRALRTFQAYYGSPLTDKEKAPVADHACFCAAVRPRPPRRTRPTTDGGYTGSLPPVAAVS